LSIFNLLRAYEAYCRENINSLIGVQSNLDGGEHAFGFVCASESEALVRIKRSGS
jgi:hypothetical protein